MRFRGLDLNLLIVFHMLMEERSVSGAARQLNLSQPATSAALSRLRLFFNDDILVVQGKRMYPTAFAEAMHPQVRDALTGIDRMLMTGSHFDPANSERTFRVIASDYIIASLIVPLVERISREAPRVGLELASPSETAEAEVADGSADLLIAPESYMRGDQPSELLFEERHVVVGWSENPLFVRTLTEEDLLAAGHVGVRIGAQRSPAFADRQMSLMNYNRRIEVETASFLTIPLLLCGTQRLALMQERLARRMQTVYPLAIAEMPFEFPKMREMIQFHRTRVHDEGLIWLKSLLHAEVNKFN